MDRKTLKLPFALNSPRDWPCPACRGGVLRIKADTFHRNEIRKSRDHSHDAWDPNWISFTFSCILICQNETCQETVSCAGVGSVSEEYFTDEDGATDSVYEEYFYPKYFEPHLRLFKIPEACPQAVSDLLNESFRLVFASPSAASNNVRRAMEELLTVLKVPRFSSNKTKRLFLSLHNRILLLPPKFEQLKELILAIKWLGNAGSHSDGQISLDDVMDSYEMFEHILQQIYASKTKHLLAMAKSVNKRRGPLRRKLKPPF